MLGVFTDFYFYCSFTQVPLFHWELLISSNNAIVVCLSFCEAAHKLYPVSQDADFNASSFKIFSIMYVIVLTPHCVVSIKNYDYYEATSPNLEQIIMKT